MTSSDTREDHLHNFGSFLASHFLGSDTSIGNQNHIKEETKPCGRNGLNNFFVFLGFINLLRKVNGLTQALFPALGTN